MFSKKLTLVLVAAVLSVITLAFFGPAQARQPDHPEILDVRLADNVALDEVIFESDHSLDIHGQAFNNTGDCLTVQVFVEGEREAWWPVYRCVSVDEVGQWSLRVPSDDGGRPLSVQLRAGD